MPYVCARGDRDHRGFWPGDSGFLEGVGPSPSAGVRRIENSYGYLIQRLSVAVQRGNSAAVLGSARSLDAMGFPEAA